MRILFVHQNFPGQFLHLAPALAARGHQVLATTLQKIKGNAWQGVTLVPYSISQGTTPGIHPWAGEVETQVIRGDACFRAALKLKEQGFTPDIIIAHPGWGESLFLKDVWPETKIGIYCEFFYHPKGVDVGFDPEFLSDDKGNDCRLRMKNVNSLMHFEFSDAGICPTHWQASTFPERFRKKMTVIHDGIRTDKLVPNPEIRLSLNHTLTLFSGDPVITFINRNLEPYRGYHIFMRALPEILQRHPRARALIVGGTETGYGARAPQGTTWKDIFLNEVRDKIDISRVHFLGRIPYEQYMAVMQLSAVHVYLTYPFVLSWSLLEAMSMGCAVVASDTKPVHEAIEHNVTGRKIDFFDITALADTVIDLLNHPGERKRLGHNARKFVIETFDLEKVCLPAQIRWAESLAAPDPV
jgi:glycosyltransferase involved in cell wall biosynthesis